METVKISLKAMKVNDVKTQEVIHLVATIENSQPFIIKKYTAAELMKTPQNLQLYIMNEAKAYEQLIRNYLQTIDFVESTKDMNEIEKYQYVQKFKQEMIAQIENKKS